LWGWFSKVAVLVVVIVYVAIFFVDLLKTRLESFEDAFRPITDGLKVATAFSSSVSRRWVEWQLQSRGVGIWVWIIASFIVRKQKLLVVTRVDLSNVLVTPEIFWKSATM
jgi:hypothetical protein